MEYYLCGMVPQPIPVVVLNWNGAADTNQCLQHLREQRGCSIDVHIIDNGSEGDELSAIQSLETKYPAVHFHYNKENLGFVGAYNQFLEQYLASDECAPYILLLNNDAFPERDWAMKMIEAASRTNASMVSSKMIQYYHRDRLDNVGHRMLNTAEVIPLGHGELIQHYTQPISHVGACAGACLYRTDMLKKIGLFDTYFQTGYEDAELGVRAMVMGYSSIFEPNALVYHKVSASINKIKDFDYVAKTQKNIFYTYFKLMPWPVIAINSPFLFFKYGMVIFLNWLFGRHFFARVMRQAIYSTFFMDWREIMDARRQFMAQKGRIGSITILRNMTFFLGYDIKRFVRFMLRGDRSDFERTMDNLD